LHNYWTHIAPDLAIKIDGVNNNLNGINNKNDFWPTYHRNGEAGNPPGLGSNGGTGGGGSSTGGPNGLPGGIDPITGEGYNSVVGGIILVEDPHHHVSISTNTPEPSNLALLGLGTICISAYGFRRRVKNS
jgi:hypothetical protein